MGCSDVLLSNIRFVFVLIVILFLLILSILVGFEVIVINVCLIDILYFWMVFINELCNVDFLLILRFNRLKLLLKIGKFVWLLEFMVSLVGCILFLR